MKLNRTKLTLKTGEKFQLTATILPANAANKKLTWKSDKTGVVKVSSKGLLTAVSVGTATITATAKSGVKVTCKVTVKPIEVTKVTLDKTAASTNVGLTVQLNAKATPTNAADTSITWKSSNTRIATVTKKGLVKAVRSGTVTVTASAKNGVKATCTVTVAEKYVYQAEKDGVYRLSATLTEAKKLKKEGWTYQKAFRVAGKSTKPVYFICNKNTKRYRYTTDKTLVTAAKKAGHKTGTAFYGSETRSVPVYELVMPGKRPTYFYTISKATVKAMKKQGWTSNGTAWYAEPKPLK